MTSNHLLYIPIVLLTGLFLGFTLANFNRRGPPRENQNSYRFKAHAVASSFAVFLMTLTLTHILPIPGGVKSLHVNIGEQQLFGQHPSFSREEVYQRIGNFGDAGRESYQLFTYTSDLIFPLSLLLFLVGLTKFIQERSRIGKVGRMILNLMPFLWFIADILENVTIFLILSNYPSQNILFATALGYLTVGKFFFLFSSVVFPIVAYLTSHMTASLRETYLLKPGQPKW